MMPVCRYVRFEDRNDGSDGEKNDTGEQDGKEDKDDSCSNGGGGDDRGSADEQQRERLRDALKVKAVNTAGIREGRGLIDTAGGGGWVGGSFHFFLPPRMVSRPFAARHSS